jgi:ArsR family transcriptional regulator, lead/cadmium/zinc/bismuth-responsive transcriptional repressor
MIERGAAMNDQSRDIERCYCNVIHEDIINKVKGYMPAEESLYDLAELFKVFGDSTRVRILWALNEEEMCVCDIAVLLNMTQSAISHQLRVLKQARLVKHRKDGKIVYYSLDDEHVRQIFDQGLIHISEQS